MGDGWSGEYSGLIQHLSIKFALIRALLTAPQNNFNRNIKDHTSRTTLFFREFVRHEPSDLVHCLLRRDTI